MQTLIRIVRIHASSYYETSICTKCTGMLQCDTHDENNNKQMSHENIEVHNDIIEKFICFVHLTKYLFGTLDSPSICCVPVEHLSTYTMYFFFSLLRGKNKRQQRFSVFSLFKAQLQLWKQMQHHHIYSWWSFWSTQMKEHTCRCNLLYIK